MFIHQRTIRNKISCQGVGLHSGVKTHITLNPAAEDTGVVFRRTDVSGNNLISASYLNVTKTMLGTTISNGEHEVSTIEHLMAALWGLGVDNCIIDIDAPEVPIMDGSSEPFIFLIECAGIKIQEKSKRFIEVLKEVTVKGDNGAYVTISPDEGFSVSLEIVYDDKVISRQSSKFNSEGFSFKSDISRARTFGFEHEVEYMRANGLARGGSLDNAIVVNKEKGEILNEEGLRYNDEFVKHKILDCIGDVYLAGSPIKGHITGFKSGHCLNNKLLREFFADKEAWRLVQLPCSNSTSVIVQGSDSVN